MKNSKQFSLTTKDFVKALVIVILTAIVTPLITMLDSGHFPTLWSEWSPILIGALSTGLAYILKNWLTNSNDQFLKKEDA